VAELLVEGVTKRFGGLLAVDAVSLSAEADAITALIGPNGAGKTTLFNAVTGFEPADAGAISFAGRRIERLKPWRIARLGMVRTFQTPIGFPTLSVWENLMVGGSDPRSEGVASALLGPRTWWREQRGTHRRAEELMDQLDLSHRRDTPLEDLTAGETKLVEFARQLMSGPRMLLLDEPASGVDPAHIGRLAALIKRLHGEGIAVLVIDHNLSFILSIAHVVYVLGEGRLIAQGTPEAVSRDAKVIETYLGSGA
jgi:branched-chain amino acid transport system ATP-binding protein